LLVDQHRVGQLDGVGRPRERKDHARRAHQEMQTCAVGGYTSDAAMIFGMTISPHSPLQNSGAR
jgi:hypothetical protein